VLPYPFKKGFGKINFYPAPVLDNMYYAEYEEEQSRRTMENSEGVVLEYVTEHARYRQLHHANKKYNVYGHYPFCFFHFRRLLFCDIDSFMT